MGRQQVRGTVIHEWDSHDIVVEEDSMHMQIVLIQGVEKNEASYARLDCVSALIL